MLNNIPIVGWFIDFALKCSLAIPFFICWSVCGIGPTYFSFLPEQFHYIPFWNAVGLFISLGILNQFVPKLATVINTNNTGNNNG